MADNTAETVKKTVETAANTVKASAEKAQATFQANAEQAQAAGAKAFRDVADKSAAGISELSAQGKQNLEALAASAAAAQKGVETLSAQGVAFTRKSWEDGVAAAQSMSQARSIQELLELQTTWAKSATEAYLAEVTRATDVLTASVKDSFKPINERVTASVEKFQAAR
ncbi:MULTISPECIES: phasin family protein [unclassified Brevundimonas]|uniref:phasin family protein n=1 Tax=unclassified Brevundimonas TaxID=2622653 RepID=UPI0006FB1B19|nr:MULTISPECIES: TIGR01841 family phasin [unclassified Brevundimonas]KQY83813.1 phasin family protein [Brevundimonas sp. Root1423]KRA29080.1 phasin family protein [Brevundimonas sp. Root608]